MDKLNSENLGNCLGCGLLNFRCESFPERMGFNLIRLGVKNPAVPRGGVRMRLFAKSGAMSGRIRILLILSIFCVEAPGCTTVPSEESPALPFPQKNTLSNIQLKDLAGTWQYEEANAAYPLALDQEGKGTYKWKKGRFETTSLSKGIWKGVWFQTDNDREGAFELQLEPDLQTASGHWWYTRIGDDRAPLQPGGTFMLRRLAPGLNDQYDMKPTGGDLD